MKKYEFYIKESLKGEILSEETVTICAENLEVALYKMVMWYHGLIKSGEEC